MAGTLLGMPPRKNIDDGSLADATLATVRIARSEGIIKPVDQAAVTALVRIARRIDAAPFDTRDTVLMPTYLRMIEALGLVPAGRRPAAVPVAVTPAPTPKAPPRRAVTPAAPVATIQPAPDLEPVPETPAAPEPQVEVKPNDDHGGGKLAALRAQRRRA